jgi:hypothetical protein
MYGNVTNLRNTVYGCSKVL